MAFLAPLFLFGALAIGAPILFHLIRRHTKDVVPFSSLMFLRPSPPRVHKRSRLENVWLLLLRCLALLLLALGFARPFLQKQDATKDATSTQRRTVLLIDTSASMRREDLWIQAKNRADAIGKAMAPGDDLAVMTFDRSTRTLVTFDQWRQTPPDSRAALLRERLASTAPTWAATALGTALLQGAELLESLPPTSSAQRSIMVVSDLQDGSRIDGLQGFTWPKNLTVSLDRITGKATANGSISWVSGSTEAEPAQSSKLTLRIANAADSPKDQYKLERFSAAGVSLGTSDAYVPAGQTRTVRLSESTATSGEKIVLSGDAVDFDNTVYIAPVQAPKLPVVFVGNEAADVPGQSVFYFQRALETMRQSQVELQLVRADASVPAEALPAAQLLVLGEGVTAPMAEAARAFAERGHVVLLPMIGEGSGNVLATLIGKAVPTTEASVKDYALLAQIDFQHPLFAPFADPRFSDFTKIHFWKYRRVDLSAVPESRVLAKFDSGDPAVIQIPLGTGSVVALASSWRPADSQLALSSKFVPILNALLDQSSRLPRIAAQYFIGDEVALPTEAGALTVRTPQGSEIPVSNGRFTETTEPGIYQVTPGDRYFAVNLNPEEGRLAEMPEERLTSIGVPLDRPTKAQSAEEAKDAPRKAAAELESQQKLWRWLLAAAFVILLLETWLAGRLARPSQAPAQATSP